jgi:parallel beta-helix repeat protein
MAAENEKIIQKNHESTFNTGENIKSTSVYYSSKSSGVPDPKVVRDGSVIYTSSTIQDAIDHAQDGDVIEVDEGVYTENVNVYHQLTIMATGDVADTIVNPQTTSSPVFTIKTAGGGTTIQGLSIVGTGDSGIEIESSDNNKIQNNIISNFGTGIGVFLSSNNDINNNIINSCINYGIYTEITTGHNNINHNTLANSRIMANGGSKNLITNNSVTSGEIYVGGSTNNTITGNTIKDNTYDGMRIRSSSNQIENNIIQNNNGPGISLDDANSNHILGNNITQNTIGILIINSSDNYVGGSDEGPGISNKNTEDGIKLDNAVNTIISEVSFSENGANGITILNSADNQIIFGECKNNKEKGIYIKNSTGNTIAHIYFENNNYGIFIENSPATINENTIINHIGDGINVIGASGTKITNNQITNSGTGDSAVAAISLWETTNNTITGNTILEGGINLRGGANPTTGNLIQNNKISGHKNGPSTTLGNGIFLNKTSNNTIKENYIHDNSGIGIYLTNGSNNNTITENDILHNAKHSVAVNASNNNNININDFSTNAPVVINITSSSNNKLNYNLIGGPSGSHCGVYNNNSSNTDARYNWWGTNSPTYGTSTTSDIRNTGTGNVLYDPWNVLSITSTPNRIKPNSTSNITSSINRLSNGTLSPIKMPGIGSTVQFSTNLGKIKTTIVQVNQGQASTIYEAGSNAGIATVNVKWGNYIKGTSVTIDNNPPIVTAKPGGGLYKGNQIVTLTMNEPGTIYYTTDSSWPTQSSKKYSGPITISANTTLRYFAIDNLGYKSLTYTQTYKIDKIPPKVTITSPTNLSTGVSRFLNITVKFSENIFSSTGWAYIKVKNLSTGQYMNVTKIISGNILTIKTGTRSPKTWYQVIIPQGAVTDQARNKLVTQYAFKFKTGN